MDEDDATTIRKRDALGRVRLPKAQREALLDEFERSSLPGTQFARAAGVNYQSFACWVQQRRHARGDYESKPKARSSALRLMEAVVASPVGGGATQARVGQSDGSARLELLLPGGVRVFIALDAVDLRAGVNTLAALVAEKLKEDVRGGALFVFAALRAENQALKEEVETLRQRQGVLRLKVDAMARKLFGKSSEKLDAAQLQLVFDALKNEPPGDDDAKKPDASAGAGCGPEAEAPAPASHSTQRKRRTLEQIIEGLPVNEVIVDPPEVTAEPEAWQCIGTEETRLIDYLPGKFACQKIVRRKYVRKDARHLPPITAPLRTLQDRCIASPRLLAHTMSSRFELHLPYYRIERMYERLGVPIPRQTLCGWSGMASDACGLLIEHIKRNVCLFVWRTGRGASCLESIVPPGWRGLIQCDSHSAYEAFARSAAGSCATAVCRLMATSWRMPSVQLQWERKTGCSLGMQPPETARPRSTRFSATAIAQASTRRPI